jgi:hypothetical protein
MTPRSSRARAVLMSLALVGLVACSTTSTRFVNTWKAPDSAPLSVKQGDLVVCMVIIKEESARRSEEQILCEELRKRGLRPIPSYTLIPTDQVQDREKALAAIQASGAAAVFALRPVAVNKQQTYVPPTYMGPGPYSAWGPYYGYGWNAAYSPGYVVTDTVVRVEMLVYDLRQGKLLWAAQSDTTNPGELDSFIAELVKQAAAQMAREGVIAAPAS